MTHTGINYTLTGDRDRGTVKKYHYKPSPLFLNKTPYGVDIAGLKKVDRDANIITGYGEHTTKFTIGFEVEKNALHRGAVREYELFCGFEHDVSCGYDASVKGYEAVTHILPLLPAGLWRTKVYDMIHKAEKIIDDRFSPSNARCGGHITIGVEGMTGDEIRRAVRGNAGIILALFRKRLDNFYCGSNRRLQGNYEDGINSALSGERSYAYRRTEAHSKYQLALAKRNTLEFRVPSRFESVKQMMRRYELFYEVINFSINNPNGTHDSLLKRVKPIILSMYDGNTEKADNVIALSKHFRKFILEGKIHTDIAMFLQ